MTSQDDSRHKCVAGRSCYTHIMPSLQDIWRGKRHAAVVKLRFTCLTWKSQIESNTRQTISLLIFCSAPTSIAKDKC